MNRRSFLAALLAAPLAPLAKLAPAAPVGDTALSWVSVNEYATLNPDWAARIVREEVGRWEGVMIYENDPEGLWRP